MSVRCRPTDPRKSGDDTSVDGVVNTETLARRLTVVPCTSTCEKSVATAASFTGATVQGFTQRTFGGHLIGQAVLASSATLHDNGRVVNSLHAYFLRSGTHEYALRYDVEEVRDGRSFSIRDTTVTQNGRTLAKVATSFCAPIALGTPDDEHSPTAPSVPDPETLTPLHRRRLLGLPSDGIKLVTGEEWETASRPLDIRYVDGADKRCFWFRTERVEAAHQNMHRAILAFASDRSLLPVIAYERGEIDIAHTMRTASIDHAMWFHADVRSGDWYLYVQDAPFHTQSSGLARGSIFARTGRVVATVTQQGLIGGSKTS